MGSNGGAVVVGGDPACPTCRSRDTLGGGTVMDGTTDGNDGTTDKEGGGGGGGIAFVVAILVVVAAVGGVGAGLFVKQRAAGGDG